MNARAKGMRTLAPMTLKQTTNRAFDALAATNIFHLRAGRVFIIDGSGALHVVGTYDDPEEGLDDLVEQRSTFGYISFAGIEWGGVARRETEARSGEFEEQRVYIVAVVDRELEVAVRAVFERTPEEKVTEYCSSGLVVDRLKTAMACLVLAEYLDG